MLAVSCRHLGCQELEPLFKILKQKGGKVCGLLVKHEFARRFVEGPTESLKVMEIRSRQYKFLEPGDNILLISTGTGSRKALAVLEFEQCITIPHKKFPKFYGLHRVTEGEFEEYQKSLSGERDFLYGYQFELVRTFQDRPTVLSKSGEVWVWLDREQIQTGRNLARQSSSFLSAEGDDSGRSDPQPMSGQKRKGQLPEDFKTPCRKASRQSLESFSLASPEMLTLAKSNGSSDVHDYVAENQDQDLDLDDEDEDDHGAEQQDVGSGAETALLLLQSEWDVIFHGEGPNGTAILRSFNTREHFVTAIIRKEDGHYAVGKLTLGNPEVVKVTETKNFSKMKIFNRECKGMYTAAQIDSMSKNKNIWKWPLKELDWLDPSVRLPCLDENPRFKNRTFKLPVSKLAEARNNPAIPRKLDLQDTAKFFLGQLDSTARLDLQQRVASLAKSNLCIRLGTTCSGTDVCVSVMKETVKELNKLEALLFPKPCSVCMLEGACGRQ